LRIMGTFTKCMFHCLCKATSLTIRIIPHS
jgi:hypothetical protein